MSNSKRLIAFGLLIIFGILLSKNILPSVHESDSASCDEFGHIHLYKLNLSHSPNSPHHQVEQNDGDEDCHAGKNISYSVFPVDLSKIINVVIPKLVFSTYSKNDFKTPDLDPLRKPPRLS